MTKRVEDADGQIRYRNQSYKKNGNEFQLCKEKTGEIKVYFLTNLLETHFPVLIFFAS